MRISGHFSVWTDRNQIKSIKTSIDNEENVRLPSNFGISSLGEKLPELEEHIETFAIGNVLKHSIFNWLNQIIYVLQIALVRMYRFYNWKKINERDNTANNYANKRVYAKGERQFSEMNCWHYLMIMKIMTLHIVFLKTLIRMCLSYREIFIND